MEIPSKPKCPKRVYRWFILYYTIVDYHYIAPGSKLLKPGWLPIKQFNENHPIRRREWKALQKKIQEIRNRQNVNWEELNRPMGI